jgi:hypothetical protein
VQGHARTVERILRLIENDRRASEALRKLKSRGLGIDVVLEDLLLFCGQTAEEVRAQLDEGKRFRDEVIGLAIQMKNLADRIELMAPKLGENFGVRIHGDDLVPSLRDRAVLYRKLVAGVYGPYLKSIRIGGQKGREANVTSGRDQVLLHLLYLVSDGEKPRPEHYNLVAPLVAAVTGDKSELPVIIGRLLQKFKRFASKGNEKDKQRRKDDAMTIAEFAWEELKKRRAQIASPKDTFQPKKL